MMRAKIIDGVVEAWPYLDDQIRADNPNVSFPAVLAYLDLSAFGAVEVSQDAQPVIAWDEKAVAGDPELFDGEWVSLWSVEAMSEAETQAKIDAGWVNVRERRNADLAACDWTQLPDAPVDAGAWAEYRQALRDVTEQDDPFKIIWPVRPEA
jgi:hypothetical protein